MFKHGSKVDVVDVPVVDVVVTNGVVVDVEVLVVVVSQPLQVLEHFAFSAVLHSCCA